MSVEQKRQLIKNYCSGDTWFIWNTAGDPALPTDPFKAGAKLVSYGMNQLIIKGTQETKLHVNPAGKINLTPEWVKAVQTEGVGPISFYSFYTGRNPEKSALTASRLFNNLAEKSDVTPIIFVDVETQADLYGPKPFKLFAEKIRKELPDVALVGVSWAKSLYWNKNKLMRELSNQCDAIMPMAYWGGNTATQAVNYLKESWRQWRIIDPTLGNNPTDLIFALRAYVGNNGKPSPSATLAARKECMNMGSIGAAHWFAEGAIRYGSNYGLTKDFLANFPPWEQKEITTTLLTTFDNEIRPGSSIRDFIYEWTRFSFGKRGR